ncbi:mitotic-spindle organizing gamma-tubulin ring associated domain-containing protein [Neurospora intermedia]|uniref:Mitotic-spindle organizing protein 1 n=1 Tax=Neurospora intermedia TaxID=5142 RepID=A0ABR3DDC3_NEUIN
MLSFAMEKSEKQAAAQQAVDILHEISTILNCQLDRRTLSICISMIENGVKPEALAMIGGERVLLGSSKREPSNEEDDQEQMDIDLTSDGINQRYLAAPNDNISRYHLNHIVYTLRWVIMGFKELKTRYPPLCLSDSKMDQIAADLIRRLHMLLRREKISSEMNRGRRASRNLTEAGRNGGLLLGLRRARRAQSAPDRTERIKFYQEMLRFVREVPMISNSLQPSPTESWDHDRFLKDWNQRGEEEETDDAMELRETYGGEVNQESREEEQQAPIETEVIEVCETGDGEENVKDDSEQEQAPVVTTEVIEVQPSSGSNSSDDNE